MDKFRPVKNFVFVKPFKDDVTDAGIIKVNLGLVSTAPTHGEVIGVGELVKELKVGDNVCFEQGSGLRYKINEEDILLFDEEHILCVIE